jgi:hypothetical protein
MTRFEFRKTSKTGPRKSGQKGYAHENRGGFDGGAGVEDKIATWRSLQLARDHTVRDGHERDVHAVL